MHGVTIGRRFLFGQGYPQQLCAYACGRKCVCNCSLDIKLCPMPDLSACHHLSVPHSTCIAQHEQVTGKLHMPHGPRYDCTHDRHTDIATSQNHSHPGLHCCCGAKMRLLGPGSFLLHVCHTAPLCCLHSYRHVQPDTLLLWYGGQHLLSCFSPSLALSLDVAATRPPFAHQATQLQSRQRRQLSRQLCDVVTPQVQLLEG